MVQVPAEIPELVPSKLRLRMRKLSCPGAVLGLLTHLSIYTLHIGQSGGRSSGAPSLALSCLNTKHVTGTIPKIS